MARDYKHRAQRQKKATQRASVAWWKWLIVILLTVSFGTFLTTLKTSAPEDGNQTIRIPIEKSSKKEPEKKEPPKTAKKPVNVSPRFDFYTILPETEVAVPDHEIKTRAREERVGKAKDTQYIMQAGSFRNYQEADKLKARLALMGIESRIEKAKVGGTTWNRIKIGPFSKISSVNKIRSQLRKNDIDTVVMEVKS